MALRARLSAAREEQTQWPWHHAKWNAIPSSILWRGDRRMEAENYLSGGYGIRLAMEARSTGRVRLGELSKVWQPNRLKGVQVSKEYGIPFLAATQVFDMRPTARKFLSVEQTQNAATYSVSRGQILITRSGSVGRSTLAQASHEGLIISDDLLRVDAKDPKQWGWVYAFLRSPQGRAMMQAAQYGHIIKHLEIAHVEALPIPSLRDDLLAEFDVRTRKILELRIKAYERSKEAEQRFAAAFPSMISSGPTPSGFTIKASAMFGSRRRLDASCFVPSVDRVVDAFKRHAKRIEQLSDVASSVFVPGRFKHIYGDGGMPYLDSADILEVNPDVTKFVLSLSADEQKEYYVDPGWLLIPCSGQVYGNIGHTVLATDYHVGKVLTNHILRVCPNGRIRSGYLQCVLGHPQLGRPRLVRFAFGSSVPEIAAADVRTLPVPRLDTKLEDELADLTESSAIARDEADDLEQGLGSEAETLIDAFLAGDTTAFTVP